MSKHQGQTTATHPLGDVRSLIHSPEHEAALCGAVLLDSDNWADVRHLSPGEHFTTSKTRILWRTFQALEERGRAVDHNGVIELLRANGQLASIGGPLGVVSMSSREVVPNPTRAGIQSAVDAVVQAAQLRQTARAAEHLRESCMRREDLGVALSQFYGRIYDGGDTCTRPRGPVFLRESLAQTLDKISALQEDPSQGQLLTGLAPLDAGVRIQRGHMVLIAARPSMGKSALADQVALGIAHSTGAVVAQANFEMPVDDLNIRRLSRLSRVPSEAIRAGQLSDAQWGHLLQAGKRLGQLSERVCDMGVEVATVGALRATCRRLAEEHDLAVVVVDYLQLMSGQGTNREAQVSSISRALKQMALDLDVAVIALSQLNRKCEERPDKRPRMSDLRESGALEQDADTVLMVYRDEYYYEPGHKDYDPDMAGKAEIIVEKQRGGARGVTVELGFEGACTRFYDPAGGGR